MIKPALRGRRRLVLLPMLCSMLLVGSGSVLLGGCGSAESSSQEPEQTSRTSLVAAAVKEPPLAGRKGKPPKHLVVKDLREGTGIEAQKGDAMVTKFVSKFYAGQRFESSWEGREPFIFKLGAGESNPGWEKGLQGMKVGGLRELIIPPDMSSRFGTLPSGRTLIYVVELIGVLPAELTARKEPKVSPPKGAPPADLQVKDVIPGSGAKAKSGDVLTVEYVGIRYNGEPFTNSWKRKKTFRFKLGAGSVKANPGWEEGLKGMRVGGRRELVIPPKLLTPGGAEAGSSPSDTLVYVIDLLGITEPQDVKKPQPDQAQ